MISSQRIVSGREAPSVATYTDGDEMKQQLLGFCCGANPASYFGFGGGKGAGASTGEVDRMRTFDLNCL